MSHFIQKQGIDVDHQKGETTTAPIQKNQVCTFGKSVREYIAVVKISNHDGEYINHALYYF